MNQSDNLFQRFSKVFWSKKTLPPIKKDVFSDPSFDFASLLQGEAGSLYKGYLSSIGLGFSREMLYRDYSMMCESALPGAALNLYSDDSTQFDRENKATVWVTANNPIYEKKIEQLFDIIGLEDLIWDWAFTVGAFGDLMLRVHGLSNVGITSIEDDIAPIDVKRVDVDGVLLGFFCSFMQEEMFMPWEWDHFRLMTTHKREWRGQAAQRSQIQITRTAVGPRVTTKYGTSILEDARRSFKQLKLMEDTMIMARLSKSILRRIFSIDVGNMAPKKAATLINHVKTLLKKSEAIDTDKGTFDHSYSPLSVNQDLFIPVNSNGKGKITIDEMGGDPDPKSLIDIEYLRQQVIGALKVPSAYLGYESELPGALGEGPLLRLDIRYARTVKKLQRALVNGVKRLAQIHLTYLGQDPDPDLFDIHMCSVSTAEEAEKMKTLQESSDTLDSFLRVLDGLGYDDNRRDNDYLLQYLIDTGLLPASDLDIEQLKKHKEGEVPAEKRTVKRDKDSLDILHEVLDKKGDLLEKEDREVVQHMINKIHGTLGGSRKLSYITAGKDLLADLPIGDNLKEKYIKEQQAVGKTFVAAVIEEEKLKKEAEIT